MTETQRFCPMTFDGHALISVDHYKVVGTSVSVASGRIPAAAAATATPAPHGHHQWWRFQEQ